MGSKSGLLDETGSVSIGFIVSQIITRKEFTFQEQSRSQMRPTVSFIRLARNAGRVIKPPSTPVKVTLEVIRSEVSQ